MKNIDMVEYGRTGNVELYKQYDRKEGRWKLVDKNGKEYIKEEEYKNSNIRDLEDDFAIATILAVSTIVIGLVVFIVCITVL